MDLINSASTDSSDLTNVLEEASELVNLDSLNNKGKSPRIDPIEVARTAWKSGLLIVAGAGYPNTAMYMKHAEVTSIVSSAPAKHGSNNNAWAKDVVAGDDILNEDYQQYKAWIRTNSKTLVTKGTFAFNSGDKYYALHNVKYTYTYVRQSNGSVKCSGVITDVYDFKLSNYDKIVAGFANNYAVGMTTLGLIKPYNIEIKYNW